MEQDFIEESFSKMHQKLSKTSNITFEEFMMIRPIVRLEELSIGQYFVSPGSSSKNVALILSGIAKTYFFTETGKEYITHFGSEGSFIGAYTDMLKNVDSTNYVEALGPCQILVMDYRELLEVTKNNLAWAHLLRNIVEQLYVERSEKDRNISLKTAQERYEYFNKTHPNLITQIPQHQIALYLKITAATLSRLKNQSGNYKKD